MLSQGLAVNNFNSNRVIQSNIPYLCLVSYKLMVMMQASKASLGTPKAEGIMQIVHLQH